MHTLVHWNANDFPDEFLRLLLLPTITPSTSISCSYTEKSSFSALKLIVPLAEALIETVGILTTVCFFSCGLLCTTGATATVSLLIVSALLTAPPAELALMAPAGRARAPDLPRCSCSFLSSSAVTREITFRVGQGLIGALAGGHSAPVIYSIVHANTKIGIIRCNVEYARIN